MNPDLRDLLADLAAYLEQQQQAGGRFYLDAGPPPAPADQRSAAPAAPGPAPRPGAAASPSPPAPGPRPAPAPRNAREAAFQQTCATFVEDALALIARSRSRRDRGPRSSGTAQSGLFDPTPGPASTPVPPEPPSDPTARAALLTELGDEVRACTACPLHAGRRQAVPGAGNPDATLMLVGEAPGQEEDRQGLPFVGRSGMLLTDILEAIGFAREDVFIGNVLKCRPPGNRDPEKPEVAACEPYLRRQIRIIQPRLILCLGRIAGQTLLGTSAPLRALRQSVHFFAGVPVMVTFHPAALLRNPNQKRDAWDDVRLVRALHDALGADDAAS